MCGQAIGVQFQRMQMNGKGLEKTSVKVVLSILSAACESYRDVQSTNEKGISVNADAVIRVCCDLTAKLVVNGLSLFSKWKCGEITLAGAILAQVRSLIHFRFPHYYAAVTVIAFFSRFSR